MKVPAETAVVVAMFVVMRVALRPKSSWSSGWALEPSSIAAHLPASRSVAARRRHSADRSEMFNDAYRD